MKGFKQRFFSFCIHPLLIWLLWAGCLGTPCHGEEIINRIYLRHLFQEADARRLHQEKYWWILLHYRNTFRGTESLIDDPDFFLAPEGKTDPRSELRSTLSAFFEGTAAERQSAVCRFPARFQWLSEMLTIDPSLLPVKRCEPLKRMLSEIRPRSATLVFPTHHLNNPASMFGHTLLLIDSDPKSNLMSQAVNYSALTSETNGLLFAVKGLLGHYEGYYAIKPYHRIIQEYSNLHRRDIWEYGLTLSPTEIERMLRHLWEMRNIYSHYFFLDENCAYNLLFLLESARPSVDLIRRFPLWVFPIDTIRAVEAAGLIRRIDYRPSLTTRLRGRAGRLGPEALKIAIRISDGTLPVGDLTVRPMDPDQTARILDLCAEYLQYRHITRKISRSRYRETLLEVLSARSRLGNAGRIPNELPPPLAPNRMHEIDRLAVGTGIRDGDPFLEFGYRPAYGDLLDTDGFSGQGARIEFLNSIFRYYPEERKMELETLDLIHILSVSPRDRIFQPISWKLRIGLQRKPIEDGDEKQVFELNTGVGAAFSAGPFGTWFGFLEPRIIAGAALKENYAAGVGFSAGGLIPIHARWKSLVSARKSYFITGDEHRHTEFSVSQYFRMSRNHSLKLDIGWEKAYDRDAFETALNWHIFF